MCSALRVWRWRLVGEILIGFSAFEPFVGFHGSVRGTLLTITGVDRRSLVVRGKFVFVAQIGSPQREEVFTGRGEPPGHQDSFQNVKTRHIRKSSEGCLWTARRRIAARCWSGRSHQRSVNQPKTSQIYYLLTCTFCILFVCFFNALTLSIFSSHVCSCITSTLDKHHNTCQTVYPQFLHSVADTGCGRLAQRITFCQEQELSLENEVSRTVAWNTFPSDLHDVTDTGTFRKRLKSDFLIVLTTDYCWRSWTCRISAPYKFHVDF